ncbi:conserved hypothetical protein [Thermosulfidibacter takaii ABI70S6]|uniref:NHL repeat containing protein n=1 Tax=Thermosulfidibacter takaii (strain DSM 17441 / JCM 13301 / NBRC 103674 / ABI70S6) TaxID=1298851 RepID=A0A0S3QRS4_THET7|nr:NHL repeat-containing protein [Thermosulfidibacter takaii]BAT71027.1 conserved hypothetical protein [Thermosulfidibacter takaii ABI70S6]
MRRYRRAVVGRDVTVSFSLVLFLLIFFFAGWSLSVWALEYRSFSVRPLAIIQQDDMNKRLFLPTSVFYDFKTGELYVTSGGRVVVYSPDYYPLFSFGAGYGVAGARGVYVDERGNVYVCQGPSNRNLKARITVYNAALLPVREIYFKGFQGADNFIPNRIVVGDDGRMFVAGSNYRGLVILDRTGKFLGILAPRDYIVSPDMARVAIINDVTLDSRGRIYLLSEEMGRIYVYDRDGKFLFKFGVKGGSSGKLSRPRGIAVDEKRNRVYVIDYMRHTANVYNLKGDYLGEFGGRGWGPGWFNYPSDIAVDNMGNVIVADTFNNRVQVLKVEEVTGGGASKKVKDYYPNFPALQKGKGP